MPILHSNTAHHCTDYYIPSLLIARIDKLSLVLFCTEEGSLFLVRQLFSIDRQPDTNVE
jgi:hypothetical protein